MRSILTLCTPCFLGSMFAQNTYFPPATGNTWETVDPASLGWCTDSIAPLLEFVEANNSKAFIVLKDGRIAIEHLCGHLHTGQRVVLGQCWQVADRLSCGCCTKPMACWTSTTPAATIWDRMDQLLARAGSSDHRAQPTHDDHRVG
ncbi:MAG: hypothetical protein IPG92_14325 [Flavobacteriales bacterium]|nr:hypothetical protein [Flavobacteriales bacterium]